MSDRRARTLARACFAELVGTFVLVFFGVGSVHAAVLTGAQVGIWHVEVVWAVAISLAIYAAGAVSGTHINPAITLSFALYRGFPRRHVDPYIAAQVAGALLGALVLYALFSGALAHFELSQGIVRGNAESVLPAMCFGEYLPNPAIAAAQGWTSATVGLVQAMLGEGIGTAFLAFFVFAVTDASNASGPGARLAPVCIGLTVAIVIYVLAPLTQAGLNPARDFGPRPVASLAGWGAIAIPGPRNGFFLVYILSPCIGACLGSGTLPSVECSRSCRQPNGRRLVLSAAGMIAYS